MTDPSDMMLIFFAAHLTSVCDYYDLLLLNKLILNVKKDDSLLFLFLLCLILKPLCFYSYVLHSDKQISQVWDKQSIVCNTATDAVVHFSEVWRDCGTLGIVAW